MKRGFTTILCFCVLGVLIFSEGCKNEELPENPFENVISVDTTTNGFPLDSSSFTYIHKTILEAKCANPGCHDGAFEPDFRNVQSAYSTLVYHPIIKNNSNADFTYRVVPYDTALSVFYERITNCCFVNVNDRMPQDNIGVPLPNEDIKLIRDWIVAGAPDMFGQLPVKPDNYPAIQYFVATNSDYSVYYSDNRVDSSYLNPFLIPKDSMINLVVFITDDITDVCNLTINQLKMSYDRDFTSISKSYTANCFLGGNDFVWQVTFNSSDFTPGSNVYMRYYVNDGEHADNTEFPNDASFDGYKGYWSFYVEP